MHEIAKITSGGAIARPPRGGCDHHLRLILDFRRHREEETPDAKVMTFMENTKVLVHPMQLTQTKGKNLRDDLLLWHCLCKFPNLRKKNW